MVVCIEGPHLVILEGGGPTLLAAPALAPVLALMLGKIPLVLLLGLAS